ncbi:MAG: hypothetical protein A2Z18_05695 [Armatimonadetes bacterium RBG_16_58_9]|nr:MAG: hypothetical protein A2Z18_05695 [Armatimonadetes bacterium RBG_16_58_9]
MNQIAYIDHLLRNREQVASDLQDESKVGGNTSASFKVFVGLSVLYGVIMGAHGLIHGRADGWKFVIATAAKLPLLFLLTLAICLPLLYVLNVLIGPRARFRMVLGMLVASISATSIVLASFSLILLFFMFSTDNYHFIMVLNTCVFAVAGLYGGGYLRKAMAQLYPPTPPPAPGQPSPKDSTSTIMNWWLITYGIVGAQMAWLMRPFIGSPSVPFSLFRARESNIYIAILTSIGKLLGIS